MIFISYNHEDEQWATWIAKTLEDSGYTTIIQAWDFKPGNNFILEMQKAVTNSHKTLLVLSKTITIQHFVSLNGLLQSNLIQWEMIEGLFRLELKI